MSQSIQSSANWSELPESLWLKIFSYCDSIDLLRIKDVCLQWSRISKDISLTSRLDLRSNIISKKLLLKMIKFCQNNLTSLRVKGYWNRSPIVWIDSKDYDIVNEKILRTLKRRSKRLKYLFIENICGLNSNRYLSKHLIHLTVNCCETSVNFFSNPLKTPNLECLDISHCQTFESQMCLFLNELKSLKSIYMEGLGRVNDGGISHLNNCLISQLVIIDLEGTDVKDESLQRLLYNGNSLRELYLGRTQITAKIDFNKSVSTQLKVLCLLNTFIDIQSMTSFLRIHSTLTCVNCDENIRQAIDSSILITKPIGSDSNVDKTCHHYVSHRCHQY